MTAYCWRKSLFAGPHARDRGGRATCETSRASALERVPRGRSDVEGTGLKKLPSKKGTSSIALSSHCYAIARSEQTGAPRAGISRLSAGG
jgi:hypothetical protein